MENNVWSDSFGACYTTTGLIRRGVTPDNSLVSIRTTEGEVLYPQAQFRVTGVIGPGLVSLVARREALELWGKYFRPAIKDGVIDEYTAAANFAGRNLLNPEEPSTVEQLDSSQTTQEEREQIEKIIRRTITALSSP